MKGDFSRFTFDPKKHFRGVRMQQGRVQLDADWNEQIDIINHYLAVLLSDLLGSGGAPQQTAGFEITMIDNSRVPIDAHDGSKVPTEEDAQNLQRLRGDHPEPEREQSEKTALDFSIGRGRYYVAGILCENEQDRLFSAQPDYPQAQLPELKHYGLVYLDVWERHITAFEDNALREIALGGIDTGTRVQTVWQVKLLPLGSHHTLSHSENLTYEDIVTLPEWREMVARRDGQAMLSARRIKQSSALDNLLYRVEIHHVHGKEAACKWSRENGSVVFEVESVQSYERDNDGTGTCIIALGDLGRDTSQLQKGDWVEFIDDFSVLHNRTAPLYQVLRLSGAPDVRATLAGEYSETIEALARDKSGHLLLRRWDHNPANPASREHGTLPVQEDVWIDLERGIQVRFSGGTYEVGDYWLIPSRALPDRIEWPADEGGPLAVPPRGNDHHYTPLALLHARQDKWTVAKDLRRSFTPLPDLSARAEQPPLVEKEVIDIEQVVERNTLYEECASREVLAPGDLVSLVPGPGLHVTKANRDNAKLVFGVVSGEKEVSGKKRFHVTIYGRAQCKVTGPVEAGDLLTASETDGCATKTESLHEFFKPGSLVGKALTSYTPDESDSPGMINMMVTLQ